MPDLGRVSSCAPGLVWSTITTGRPASKTAEVTWSETRDLYKVQGTHKEMGGVVSKLKDHWDQVTTLPMPRNVDEIKQLGKGRAGTLIDVIREYEYA